MVTGARALFKGLGSVNGEDNFGFMLTAVDGQLTGGGGTDRFRTRVWERATGDIPHDNQMGASDDADPATSVSGGSIVVRKPKK